MEGYIVPIDACYELVGHLRRLWRGFGGGDRGPPGDGRLLRAGAAEGGQGGGARRRARRWPRLVTELRFDVLGARAERYAAEPRFVLRLRIESDADEPIHALMLRCQLRIEPQRRRYDGSEEERLYAVFGLPSGWGESLRPFLWTHVATAVAGFTGSTEVDLHVPCTYDMEVAATRYLHALGDGDIPTILLFSGRVFTRGRAGSVVEPVSVLYEGDVLHPYRASSAQDLSIGFEATVQGVFADMPTSTATLERTEA